MDKSWICPVPDLEREERVREKERVCDGERGRKRGKCPFPSPRSFTYVGKRSVTPTLAWMRSVILPYVKLTCAYVEKRSVAPALALMRSVMLLCVKLTCTYVDKRRVAPTLAWMRRAIPDQYFLPNSDVILFYEKIYYIRISLSREE